MARGSQSDRCRAQRLVAELTTLSASTPSQLRERLLKALLSLVEADVAGFYTIGVIKGQRVMVGWQGVGSALTSRCMSSLSSDAGSAALNDNRFRDYTRPRLIERSAFVEDTLLWPPEQFLESSIYRNLLAPAGLSHQQRLLAYHGSRFLGWVGLGRAQGAPPFTPMDRRHLGPMVRATVTVLLTADRLGRAAQPEEAGDILLTPRGTVSHASQVGRAWLEVPGFREPLVAAVKEWDRASTSRSHGGALREGHVVGHAMVHVVQLDSDTGVRYLVHVAPLEGILLHPDSPLTPRQRQIAYYIAAGATVGETAKVLCISTETVRTHLRVIYRCLEVSSRVELARALQQA